MNINKNGVWTSENDYVTSDVYNRIYYTGSIPTYTTGSGGWTKTSKGSYTNYRMEKPRPTGDNWPNFDCKTFSFVIDDKYMWRCWIRCNECTAGVSLGMRASRAQNDWVTTSKTVCSSSLADGKWHEYYIIQTIPETFVRSSSTVTSAPLFEMYCSNLKSASTETIIIDFDIKNIEIIHTPTYVSQGAYLEEGDMAKIYKDQIRGHDFIEM